MMMHQQGWALDLRNPTQALALMGLAYQAMAMVDLELTQELKKVKVMVQLDFFGMCDSLLQVGGSCTGSPATGL